MADSGITVDMGSVQNVIDALEEFHGQLYDAIQTITDVVAKKMEEYAKDNAIWENQTSNARQGLRGDAYWENASTIVCSLSHTMEYGVWLELAHERKYAILEKSIEAYKQELFDAWKTVAGVE